MRSRAIKDISLRISTMVLLSLISYGCAGIGPRTIARDRFDYTTAISDSWKRQMLLNMVMMRYGDAPMFLDVASIINQYSVETDASGSLFWAFPPAANSQAISGHATYTDRPTITYNPLMGQKFAQNLMTPIPIGSILSLINSGYPVDLVFRLCAHSINGIRNRYGGRARTQFSDPEFYLLIEKLRRLQQSGTVGFRIQEEGAERTALLVLHKTLTPELEDDKREVRRLLGLNPDIQAFRVVYGAIAKDDNEIAILSRSILEILMDLASDIDVPEAHIAEKRANPTFSETTAAGTPIAPLMQIHSSREKPSDAFVSVPYREYWFWVDDKDYPSKAIFSSLMLMFSLTETGTKEGAPIVTIPAG